MKENDFDKDVQNIFNRLFRHLKSSDWKKWLEIKSIEEYEDIMFEKSGIGNKIEFSKMIDSITTNSRDFSVNVEDYVLSHASKEPLILCHTSGTTDANISNLKWFHMNEELIDRIWNPGMSAIFESSGLNKDTSAVIFVPSRTKFDGMRTIKNNEFISLYSSEFSQRLALSTIKPKEYLFYEYKNSENLEVISKILSMENLSVISAPAATILGWSDREKLKNGFLSFLKKNKEKKKKITNYLNKIIKNEGINKGTLKIQELLSDKLSQTRLIFSISNLSRTQWSLISKFMKWSNGKKRFTNLYVGSEVGPFACSLTETIANNNQMHVFPLTIPAIENKGKRELISQTKLKIGNLLVSYSINTTNRINIDIGDVISIEDFKGLPIIRGTILRKKFKLKYPIRITPKIEKSPDQEVFVGHYFPFEEFEINNPMALIECLKNKANLRSDSLLLRSSTDNAKKFELILSTYNGNNINKAQELEEHLMTCNLEGNINRVLQDGKLMLKIVNEPPIDYTKTREEMLSRVRMGISPKGVLKKWPLYVLEKKMGEKKD